MRLTYLSSVLGKTCFDNLNKGNIANFKSGLLRTYKMCHTEESKTDLATQYVKEVLQEIEIDSKNKGVTFTACSSVKGRTGVVILRRFVGVTRVKMITLFGITDEYSLKLCEKGFMDAFVSVMIKTNVECYLKNRIVKLTRNKSKAYLKNGVVSGVYKVDNRYLYGVNMDIYLKLEDCTVDNIKEVYKLFKEYVHPTIYLKVDTNIK